MLMRITENCDFDDCPFLAVGGQGDLEHVPTVKFRIHLDGMQLEQTASLYFVF